MTKFTLAYGEVHRQRIPMRLRQKPLNRNSGKKRQPRCVVGVVNPAGISISVCLDRLHEACSPPA